MATIHTTDDQHARELAISAKEHGRTERENKLMKMLMEIDPLGRVSHRYSNGEITSGLFDKYLISIYNKSERTVIVDLGTNEMQFSGTYPEAQAFLASRSALAKFTNKFILAENIQDMNPSENALNLAKQFEGLRLQPYQDIAGFWTIGRGHRINGEQYGSITEVQADQLLIDDMNHAAQVVNDYCQDFLTSQNKFDAICDAVFNLGTALFVNYDTSRTHFYKALIVGDYQTAAEHLLDFCHTRGEVVQGLLNRRKAEQSLFLTPDVPLPVS